MLLRFVLEHDYRAIVAIENQCTPDRTTTVRSVCKSFQLLLYMERTRGILCPKSKPVFSDVAERLRKAGFQLRFFHPQSPLSPEHVVNLSVISINKTLPSALPTLNTCPTCRQSSLSLPSILAVILWELTMSRMSSESEIELPI